jgi:spermidine synthase
MLMSSLQTTSEEALATRGVAVHGGAGLRVLVGGLGLGYTARAALASDRVAHVRVVEHLPAVIGWLRGGLIPLAAELARDSRLEVVEGDVYGLLLGPPPDAAEARWDLVLIDVDHTPDEPLGPASATFYDPIGLGRVAEHLAPGGVLGVWSAGDDDPRFAAALRAVFAETWVERVRWTDERIDEGREVEDVLFFARRA